MTFLQYTMILIHLKNTLSQSPDYEVSLPVTEKSNPLTRDLDRASANDIVTMLEACDSQIFHHRDSGGCYQVDTHTHLELPPRAVLFFFPRIVYPVLPET